MNLTVARHPALYHPSEILDKKICFGRVLRRHFDILARFEAKISDNPEYKSLSSREKWEAMDASQRLLTLQMAIKVRESTTDASPANPGSCK
jgi:hypothetical protein